MFSQTKHQIEFEYFHTFMRAPKVWGTRRKVLLWSLRNQRKQYYIKKLGKVWDIPQDVSDEIFGLVWPTPATPKPLNIKVIYVVSHPG